MVNKSISVNPLTRQQTLLLLSVLFIIFIKLIETSRILLLHYILNQLFSKSLLCRIEINSSSRMCNSLPHFSLLTAPNTNNFYLIYPYSMSEPILRIWKVKSLGDFNLYQFFNSLHILSNISNIVILIYNLYIEKSIILNLLSKAYFKNVLKQNCST